MGKFKNIRVFIKKTFNSNNKQNISETKKIFNTIIKILKNNCQLSFDASCNDFITDHIQSLPKKPNNKCDLIIVIGGDGTILNCIRNNINKKTPILGIHQGRLGFLADLSIDNIKRNLLKILSGEYIEENRSLLCAKIKNSQKFNSYLGVNDIVLCNDKIPKLIEFQIFIDNSFVLQQRADGLIISTPTGSTAYSLSAGGPIVYPTLKNFALVPLYPHTLNSRPIIVNENSIIKLKILDPRTNKEQPSNYTLSFDGQENIQVALSDEITITKYPIEARLIHPKNYNYFTTLRTKLGWNI